MESITSSVLIEFVNASPYLALIAFVLILFKGQIAQWLKKPLKAKKKISTLQYHDMFSTATFVLKKVQAISFSSNGVDDVVKTKMLHKLIDFKVSCIKKNFKSFLLDDNLEKMDSNQLKFKVFELLHSLVDEYNMVSNSYFVNELGISHEDSKFLIDSYEKYRQDIIDGFIDRLESITTNDDYDTNFAKISAVLEVVAISLYVIPKDAKQAMDEVNGRYIKYKKNKNEAAINKNS